MTDITERLRRLYVQHGTDYVQEAAGEIESLRAELARKDEFYTRLAEVHEGAMKLWESQEREAEMKAYELAAENKGMREEVERLRHDIERHIAIASELATENERLRAEFAEVRPDCRTCQHFYSDFDLGEAQCGFNNTGVGILCVAGDRHEPFDPVRLYAIDAAMAGGE